MTAKHVSESVANTRGRLCPRDVVSEQLVEPGRNAIATITVGITGDPDFWNPNELRERAVYVSKMASKIERAGEGIGALMIRWTQDYASTIGQDFVRWDAWRTNPQLQNYYPQTPK